MPTQRNRTVTTKTDLTNKAYHAIRQMLFYNEIQPGEKIKYKDLAGRIGVSMTPVIQALKWLEFRNIVRHEPNRGYYINKISLKEITEVYNTRLLLEVSLVPEIMAHLDGSGIKAIRAAMAEYEQAVAVDNYHRRMLTDMDYHLCLASLADARIQLKMLQELFDVLLLRYSRNLYFASVTETSPGEHARILDCVEQQDEAGLKEALRHHIVTVRDHIIKGMSQFMTRTREPLTDTYPFREGKNYFPLSK